MSKLTFCNVIGLFMTAMGGLLIISTGTLENQIMLEVEKIVLLQSMQRENGMIFPVVVILEILSAKSIFLPQVMIKEIFIQSQEKS